MNETIWLFQQVTYTRARNRVGYMISEAVTTKLATAYYMGYYTSLATIQEKCDQLNEDVKTVAAEHFANLPKNLDEAALKLAEEGVLPSVTIFTPVPVSPGA